MKDLIGEISSTLKQNKLRTALTGFAVTWGIFIIIILLGAGNGLMNALMDNSGSEIKRLITVYPGSTSLAHNGIKQGTRVRLTDADVDFIEEYSDKVLAANGTVYYSDTLKISQDAISCSITSTSPEMKDRNRIPMMGGRFINKLDMDQCRKSVVMDDELATMLLGDRSSWSEIIGRYVNVGDIPFKVVGVYERDANAWGHDVYVPFTTARKMRTDGMWLSNIVINFTGMESVEENEDFEKDLQRSFNIKRGYDPTDNRTLYLWNMFTSQKETTKAMGIIRIALWILGFLTLLSGIVGISNIMLITVKERTREFGIRKALGAKPVSILNLVVVESVVITALFGFLGIMLGMLGNWYLDSTLGANPIDIGITRLYIFKNVGVGFDVAIKATLLLIVCGTVAGIIPAWKGARVRPIEALKAEK